MSLLRPMVTAGLRPASVAAARGVASAGPIAAVAQAASPSRSVVRQAGGAGVTTTRGPAARPAARRGVTTASWSEEAGVVRCGVSMLVSRRHPSIVSTRTTGSGDSMLRYLLCQRGKAPGLYKWTLPGGHIKLGETMLDAAARELLEETSLGMVAPTVEASARHVVEADLSGRHGSLQFYPCPFFATDAIYALDSSLPNYHYVIVQLRAWADEEMANRAAPRSDVIDLRWVSKADILAMRHSGELLGLVEEAVARSEAMVEAQLLTPEKAVQVFVPH